MEPESRVIPVQEIDRRTRPENHTVQRIAQAQGKFGSTDIAQVMRRQRGHQHQSVFVGESDVPLVRSGLSWK